MRLGADAKSRQARNSAAKSMMTFPASGMISSKYHLQLGLQQLTGRL